MDITPPIGTSSAGYQKRSGIGMQGIHDPCLATALLIDDGEKFFAFVSVDHLGFDYSMVEEIRLGIQQISLHKDCHLILGSTHTHSGGGGYLNIPGIGEVISGTFNPQIRQFYIDATVEAIETAAKNLRIAKLGIETIELNNLNVYRGSYPKEAEPRQSLTVWKIVDDLNTPFAILYNFPIHPTVLPYQNLQFSADFVASSRQMLQETYGNDCHTLFFNGAQGDVTPLICPFENLSTSFAEAKRIGKSMASAVITACDRIQPQDDISFKHLRFPYSFEVKPTILGTSLPIKLYHTELNLLVVNESHAFACVPGELSCVYDARLQKRAEKLGFESLSIFGLCNDAHGYILLPQAWEIPSTESAKSFGGRNYGERIFHMFDQLLEIISQPSIYRHFYGKRELVSPNCMENLS